MQVAHCLNGTAYAYQAKQQGSDALNTSVVVSVHPQDKADTPGLSFG